MGWNGWMVTSRHINIRNAHDHFTSASNRKSFCASERERTRNACAHQRSKILITPKHELKKKNCKSHSLWPKANVPGHIEKQLKNGPQTESDKRDIENGGIRSGHHHVRQHMRLWEHSNNVWSVDGKYSLVVIAIIPFVVAVTWMRSGQSVADHKVIAGTKNHLYLIAGNNWNACTVLIVRSSLLCARKVHKNPLQVPNLNWIWSFSSALESTMVLKHPPIIGGEDEKPPHYKSSKCIFSARARDHDRIQCSFVCCRCCFIDNNNNHSERRASKSVFVYSGMIVFLFDDIHVPNAPTACIYTVWSSHDQNHHHHLRLTSSFIIECNTNTYVYSEPFQQPWRVHSVCACTAAVSFFFTLFIFLMHSRSFRTFCYYCYTFLDAWMLSLLCCCCCCIFSLTLFLALFTPFLCYLFTRFVHFSSHSFFSIFFSRSLRSHRHSKCLRSSNC